MRLRIHGISDVNNLALEADEETGSIGDFQPEHLDAVGVNNLSVGIGEQCEVQIVFLNEFFMSLGGIKTDADNFDVVRFQFAHAVAEITRLLCAAAGEILRIEIQQHDFLPMRSANFTVLPS